MNNVGTTIGFNLTWLDPGVVGGSEEYTIRLLTGVGRIADDRIGLRVYARRALFDAYPELADRFTPVAMPGRRISKPQRIAMEQTWLSRVAAADTVVHHMGGTVPFVSTARRDAGRQKVAVTIHDLQPVDLARNFGWAKRAWLGRLIPLAVERADVIVTPSRFTADRIAALYGAARSKLRVVQQGYRLDRESGASAVTAEASPLAERLQGRRFLLYPAIAYRHKRHRDLIEALSLLPPRHADIDLVFTGRPGPETERLRRQAAVACLDHRLHVVGRVPESDLHWLYDNALALTFPSEYEGFGNPCLEAMARGCPVVASNAAALPEVVDTAAILVPTGDVGRWTGAIAELADRPELVADLAARGRDRAADFDPDSASARLWAVYRELLGTDPVATAERPNPHRSDVQPPP